jgi:hypothetical protein
MLLTRSHRDVHLSWACFACSSLPRARVTLARDVPPRFQPGHAWWSAVRYDAWEEHCDRILPAVSLRE